MKYAAFVLLLYTIPLLIFANEKTSDGSLKTGSDIVYIDVFIDQPNVEDCYDDETFLPELLDTDWIKIYPNPNHGHFTLEINHLATDEGISISIVDLTGKQRFTFRVEKHSHQLNKELNLSTLPRGVYFIHIQVRKRTSVERLIIF